MAPRKRPPAKPPEPADPSDQAREDYEYAHKRYLETRREWEAQGKPLTTFSDNGIEYVHPLWKLMIEAESQAAKLREKATPKKAPGRPVGKVSAPDRVSRPAPMLRAVK